MTDGSRPLCFDARMVHHSGIGTHIRGLTEALQALGTSGGTPPLAFLGDPNQLERYPYFREAGPIHPWKAPIYSAAEQLTCPHVPEAAAYHFPHYNVPQLLRPSRPFAVTVHDLIHLLFPEVVGSRLKQLAGRALMLSAVRRAGAVLTVSECSRRDISRLLHVPEEQIVITPNAVHPSFQPVTHEALHRVRESLGLLSRYLLAVGIAKAHKNLPFLIETFLDWRQRTPGAGEIQLVICGVGESGKAELLQVVRRQPSERHAGSVVRFLPYVEPGKLPALYQGAEALVFPSLYEGFGLPVLEAQRVGTPVIASSAASIPEAGGDAALYFDPKSSSELLARLDELFQGGPSLRNKLAQVGRTNEQRFSWTTTAQTVTQVYRRLMS